MLEHKISCQRFANKSIVMLEIQKLCVSISCLLKASHGIIVITVSSYTSFFAPSLVVCINYLIESRAARNLFDKRWIMLWVFCRFFLAFSRVHLPNKIIIVSKHLFITGSFDWVIYTSLSKTPIPSFRTTHWAVTSMLMTLSTSILISYPIAFSTLRSVPIFPDSLTGVSLMVVILFILSRLNRCTTCLSLPVLEVL